MSSNRLLLAVGTALALVGAPGLAAPEGAGVYAFSTSAARPARVASAEPMPGMPRANGQGTVQQQRRGVVLSLQSLTGDDSGADSGDALVELTLRMDDGSRLTVAQPQGASFVQPGDRIEVVSAGLALRVVLAQVKR